MKEGLFHVGTVVGFHGLQGYVKVRPSTNNFSILADISSVAICLTDGKTNEEEIEDLKVEKRGLLIKFANYSSRTVAEFMLKAEIYVDPDQLIPLTDDEWWVNDLVGLTAYTYDDKQNKQKVGTIVNVIDNGVQIIEISPNGDNSGKTILIPFVKALIPKVDCQLGQIEIVNLPGLLEMQ